MLTIFRRHTDACELAYKKGKPEICKKTGVAYATRPRSYRKCECPIHCEGKLAGVMYRKNLDTRAWTVAQARVRQAEGWESFEDPNGSKRVSIREAIETFLAGITGQSNGKARSTNRGVWSALHSVNAEYKAKARFRQLCPALLEWTAAKGLVTVDQLTLPALTEYLGQMVCSPAHYCKRIRTIKRFIWFCVRSKWLGHDHPALYKHGFDMPSHRALAIKVKQPYTETEMANILATARTMYDDRLVALVCLMRYAGLRISDAATLNQSSIQSGAIMLGAMVKTGDPLYMPMHPELKAAMAKIEPNAAGYYFWSGESAVTTATDNNRARLVEVFKACQLTGAHPHRFRHTFAVDLLVRGVAIDLVSKALGHSSIKITEKHYAPFVEARRVQLATAVSAAWGMAEPSKVVSIAREVAA